MVVLECGKALCTSPNDDDTGSMSASVSAELAFRGRRNFEKRAPFLFTPCMLPLTSPQHMNKLHTFLYYQAKNEDYSRIPKE